MKVAYFTNQYPAVSHTFIRREIQALEALGLTVLRFAIRLEAGKSVLAQDNPELSKTRYIRQAGGREILRCMIRMLLGQPRTTARVGCLAIKMGWRSDRGLWRHIAYVVESIVLADWCYREGVQHLHAHFGTNSAAIAMFAGMFSGTSYSFTAHGSEEFEKAPLLSLDVKLEHAAFAVCVSSFGRAQLMRWCEPRYWHKIFCVHCGLESSYLQTTAAPIPSAPRFVCVGRLGEHKAQLLLVEAVKRLRDIGTRCEVVLAGDGPMRPALEIAIRDAGLVDLIRITGWISSEQVQKEISAARALILPSFSENMPVVIMEAMALGRPVISTYIAGIPELVDSGKSGWLVPASDVDALTSAISAAIVASPDDLARMGAVGRARVLDEFDALKEARKLKQLFEGTIESNAAVIRETEVPA